MFSSDVVRRPRAELLCFAVALLAGGEPGARLREHGDPMAYDLRWVGL